MRVVALFVLWVAFACQAASIDGRVVGVADGGTTRVLDGANRQHKIRLAGIDAPEKSQPFGHRSKDSLSDLVFSKTVIVETEKVDRYGRQVGKVLVDPLSSAAQTRSCPLGHPKGCRAGIAA
jgi:endonuclease YncB( thermonuclease family)